MPMPMPMMALSTMMVMPNIFVAALPSSLARIYHLLSQPVHASTLGLFRMLFSICMMWQALKFADVFYDLRRTKMVFPYAGLDFSPPCAPQTGEFLLSVNFIAGLMVMCGACTRIATVVLFATFAYIFHITEENHNNHYILICHVTFVASFLDWGRWGSVDALVAAWLERRRRRGGGGGGGGRTTQNGIRTTSVVPYWNLLLMPLLFTIPYFYGAIAKCNHDWLLRAEPPTMWFSRRAETDLDSPLLFAYKTAWYPWFVAWGGMLFDLTISFILFSRPLKLPLGLPGVLLFNCMNKVMFNIGVFPVAMLASYTLFAQPETPAVCAWIVKKHILGMEDAADTFPYVGPRWHSFWLVPLPPDAYASAKKKQHLRTEEVVDAEAAAAAAAAEVAVTNDGEDKSSPTTQLSLHGAFVLVFLAGFATFHFLGPLRHFVLYPPGVSWHEEGHLGAWHMMLRSKHGDVMIDFLEDGAAPPPPPPPMAAASHRKHKHVHAPAHRVFISEDRFLNTRQRRKLITKPHTVLLYVQHMSRIYREAGRNLTGAYARSCYCLNARAPAKMFVETTNLLDWAYRYEYVWPFGERSGVLVGAGGGGFLTPLPPVHSPGGRDACSIDALGGYSYDHVRQEVTMSPTHMQIHAAAGLQFEGEEVKHVSGVHAYTLRWHLPP